MPISDNVDKLKGLKERAAARKALAESTQKKAETATSHIQTSAKSAGISSPLKASPVKQPSGDKKTAFYENELDKYDNVAYHIKFYMLPDSYIIAGNTSAENGIIIAETGVTAQLVIDNLAVEKFVGPGKINQNIFASKITFTIREYAGASLMDYIFNSAQVLGVKNYLQAPYFIELSFRGYMPDGKTADPLKIITYLWPISVSAVDADVTVKGTVYNFTAYPAGQIAQKQTFSRLNSAVTIANVETVGEAIDKLQEILNAKSDDKTVENVSLPDVYEINVDPELRKLKIAASDVEVQTQRTSEEDPLKRDITLNADIGIHAAIDRIISSSPEYATLMKNSPAPEETKPEDKHKPKILHNISNDTKVLAFDSRRNDYQRKFIYFVNLYEHGTLVADQEDLTADGKQKIDTYISKRRLSKRYYYSFTGLNDQVISADLKFNLAWFVNTPTQSGYQTTFESISEGHYITEEYRIAAETKKQLTAAEKLVSSAPAPKRAEAVSKEIVKMAKSVRESDLPVDEQNKIIKYSATKLLSVLPDKERHETIISLGGKVVKKGTTSTSSRFAEDLTNIVASFTPVTFNSISSDNHNTNKTTGSESEKAPSKRFVNSLFQQAFDSGTGGDLIDLNLNIKGDFYWLGNPDQSNEAKLYTEKVGNEQYAVPVDAQNYIVFSLKSPSIPDPQTGITKLQSVSFSGVYAVRKVDSVFNNGKFTQNLTCIRDKPITHTDLEDYL